MIINKFKRLVGKRIICDNIHRMADKSLVNIDYYRPGQDDNLGDYLSVVVVSNMLERCGYSLMSPSKGKYVHLFAVGTILQSCISDATVWGSGICAMMPDRINHLDLDVRLLRGALTKHVLEKGGGTVPG